MKALKRRLTGPLFLAASISLTAGCINTPDMDPEFGESVWHMQRAITEGTPAARPLDGENATRVMKNYREDVGKPKEVEKTINIQVN